MRISSREAVGAFGDAGTLRPWSGAGQGRDAGQGRASAVQAFAIVSRLAEGLMPSARVVRRVLVLSTVVAAILVTPVSRSGPGAQPATLAPHQQLLRDIYQELVEINTTNRSEEHTSELQSLR